MTEIMPFPENNCETVLLDRPDRACFLRHKGSGKKAVYRSD